MAFAASRDHRSSSPHVSGAQETRASDVWSAAGAEGCILVGDDRSDHACAPKRHSPHDIRATRVIPTFAVDGGHDSRVLFIHMATPQAPVGAQFGVRSWALPVIVALVVTGAFAIASQDARTNPTDLFIQSFNPVPTVNNSVATSSWILYEGDLSDFSVRAPQKTHPDMVVYMVRTRDQDANHFTYGPDPADRESILSILPFQKRAAVHLTDWIQLYVTDNAAQLKHVTYNNVASYPALEFDIETGAAVPISALSFFPSGDLKRRPLIPSYHYVVVDAGDRYLIANYPITSNRRYLQLYNEVLTSLRITSTD